MTRIEGCSSNRAHGSRSVPAVAEARIQEEQHRDLDRFERGGRERLERFEVTRCAILSTEYHAYGTEHVSLTEYGCLIDQISMMRAEYAAWRRKNPDASEPSDGCQSLGQILNDPELSTDEVCLRIIEVILHERPETADDIRAGIGPHEIGNIGHGPPPNTEISRGIFSAFGGLASLVGGFLQSPAAVPVLTAACALVPGLQPLAPFIPAIAPIAGAALGGLGGMASQVGQGQQPTLDASGLANPDLLAQVLPALNGLAGV